MYALLVFLGQRLHKILIINWIPRTSSIPHHDSMIALLNITAVIKYTTCNFICTATNFLSRFGNVFNIIALIRFSSIMIFSWMIKASLTEDMIALCWLFSKPQCWQVSLDSYQRYSCAWKSSSVLGLPSSDSFGKSTEYMLFLSTFVLWWAHNKPLNCIISSCWYSSYSFT